MYYGADYYPEQWTPETWDEDIRLMGEAGVNLVTVGVFAWARIQPDEDSFDWEWLDDILGRLHEAGISVDLATATASPPPWASTRYPQLLPQNADGTTYWPGSRQAYAPSSPDYRRLAARLVTELAARYAHHPAVVMWHVNNEYACHLHYDYSDNAATGFRHWLSNRYGTIDALNAAWGTLFWSQRYSSFDEILPPRQAPYSHNPCQALDFKRFTSDALLELFIMERDIIRASGAQQPVTTNFMGAFPPLDYWTWAKELDFISDDNYPDPNDPHSFRTAAFTRDLIRSLKPGRPWVLMEQSTNEVNWRPSNAPKAPGQMAALSMQAIGHGADGIMFFQWRQSQRGSEKFHSAMLPQAGTTTRTWQEVTDLGQTLADVTDLPSGEDSSRAKVALVFDWENWWALQNPDHPAELDYLNLVQRWYAALHRHHLSIDLAPPTGDLTGYQVVIAPNLYLLTDDGARNLTRFVNGGGHLLVTAFSDIVDEHDAFRSGGFQVGLRDIVGVAVHEFGALIQPSATPAGPTSAGETTQTDYSALYEPGEDHAFFDTPVGILTGQYFAEVLDILNPAVTVLAPFTTGRASGSPALTALRANIARDSGNQTSEHEEQREQGGVGYYLATIPDDHGMLQLTRWLTSQAGIAAELPDSGSADLEYVEVARRGDVLTLINHGPESVTVRLPEAVSGNQSSPSLVELAPYGWALVGAAGPLHLSEPLQHLP
ncbi:beta-galactosidase [Arthrobacter sp. B0490]|uniref:beta-galactosidase n=1 Tax=Arthrobacter sp. B0490 TaxID=2058891 RepID=UPI000CE40533|nr:beta-galactosidase [Arthrobacter sp. B0490]